TAIRKPSDPHTGHSHRPGGLILAAGLLLVCVMTGLGGRYIMSRPLFRWEAAIAGTVVLAVLLAIYGFSALVRGWSRAADRFILFGLDIVDLAVYLAIAAAAALYSGGSAFSCIMAAIGAVSAWGYSRAVLSLSGSMFFGHLAGSMILASIL
ncbi:MAG TPA: hypothetical protein VIL27_10325, partial [Clostridia bacterium]